VSEKIRQALVIYSPSSGRSTELDYALGYIVKRLCEEKKYIVNVRPLKTQLVAAEVLAPEMDETALVVAVGGDGTISTIIGAMAQLQTKVPLGIVPCGTGNLLAKSLGLHLSNDFQESLKYAMDVIMSGGKSFPLDLGKVNDKYFVVDAGLGPISNAIVAPNPRAKKMWKMFSYVFPLLKAMSKRAVTCRFTIDGESFYRNASGVFITNSHEMGIGRGVDARQFSDGHLDLCIMNPLTPMDYWRIAFRFGAWFFGGIVTGTPPYLVKKIKQVKIETDRPISVMIDGDRCGSTPIDVAVIPKAIQVMIPRELAAAAMRDELLSELEAA